MTYKIFNSSIIHYSTRRYFQRIEPNLKFLKYTHAFLSLLYTCTHPSLLLSPDNFRLRGGRNWRANTIQHRRHVILHFIDALCGVITPSPFNRWLIERLIRKLPVCGAHACLRPSPPCLSLTVKSIRGGSFRNYSLRTVSARCNNECLPRIRGKKQSSVSGRRRRL